MYRASRASATSWGVASSGPCRRRMVLRFRDDAFKTYFNNARYLEMVDRKFGQTTVEQIQEMASHTLERNVTL